jgi:hypothetical protein
VVLIAGSHDGRLGLRKKVVGDGDRLVGRYTSRRDLDKALGTDLSAAGDVGLVVADVYPGIQGRVGCDCVPLSARLLLKGEQVGG